MGIKWPGLSLKEKWIGTTLPSPWTCLMYFGVSDVLLWAKESCKQKTLFCKSRRHRCVFPVLNWAPHYEDLNLAYITMKAYLRSGDVAPVISNLGTRWKWVVSFTPRPLYPRCPLDRWLGWSHSRSGRNGEEKQFHRCPCRVSKPAHPTRSTVCILPGLPQLLFYIYYYYYYVILTVCDGLVSLWEYLSWILSTV
jgi:hypothetical protein